MPTPNKPAPFSAPDFLAFCRSKPAGEVYDWLDAHKCACGQFATSLGWSGDLDCDFRFEIERRLGGFAIDHPRTFGALASRLAKVLEQ